MVRMIRILCDLLMIDLSLRVIHMFEIINIHDHFEYPYVLGVRH